MICYFEDFTGRFHELGTDVPSRRSGTMAMAPLADMQVGEEIAVYLGHGWVKGFRREAPKTFVFQVSCVSFSDETVVWKALERALHPLTSQQDTPIPWVKIVPPSRQPGGVDG